MQQYISYTDGKISIHTDVKHDVIGLNEFVSKALKLKENKDLTEIHAKFDVDDICNADEIHDFLREFGFAYGCKKHAKYGTSLYELDGLFYTILDSTTVENGDAWADDDLTD